MFPIRHTARARRKPVTRHRLFRSLVAVSVVAASLQAASAASAAPLYPDLRMLSSTDLGLGETIIGEESRWVLYFSSRIANVGEGAAELNRTPTSSGVASLTQRIYESPVGFRDEPIGSVAFDTRPLEVPGIARYELWTAAAFRRAESRGFTRGQPLLSNRTVNHCLSDDERFTATDAVAGFYLLCTATSTGLSPGWAHLEHWLTVGQWIDLGPTMIPDGDYVLRAIADPDNLVFESAGKADAARESQAANDGISHLRIVGGQLAGVS